VSYLAWTHHHTPAAGLLPVGQGPGLPVAVAPTTAIAIAITTTTTTTTVTAPATAVAAAIASRGTLFTGTSFIDAQIAATVLHAIKGLDSSACTLIVHFHEAETTRTSGLAVAHQANILDAAVLLKQATDIIFVRTKGQITYVNPSHCILLR